MKVIILIGLLSFIHVRGADEATTTTLSAATSTSAATTSAETTENLTSSGTTTEQMPAAEQLIAKLIAANTIELNNNQNMLRDIEDEIILFSANITQQMKDIQELGALKLLAVSSVDVMKNNSLYFLKDLTNINYKFGVATGKVTYAMDNLLRDQQESKDNIVQMQNKLKDYQKNILSQSQTIDNSIVQLSKLITRSVLPRLTNLKSRFTGINSSQIILKSELSNIDNTRTIQIKSFAKLNDLEKQLINNINNNIAKNTQIKEIGETLQNLADKNLTDIANTIQNLIIEEKRIDLALSSWNKINKASLPKYVSVNTKATTKYVTGYVKKSPVNNISEQPKTNFYNHASFTQKNQQHQQKSQAVNEDYSEVYEIHQPAFEVYQVPKNIQNQLPTSYDTTTKVSYALPETFKYFANDKLQSPVLPTNNPIKTHYPKEHQSKQISGVLNYYGNIKGEDKFVQVANSRKNIPRKGIKQTTSYDRQKILYSAPDNYFKDGKIQSRLNDKAVENYYADELRSEHISETPDFDDHNKDAIKFEQGIKTYQENEDKYEFYNVNKDQRTNKYGNVQTSSWK